MFDLMACMWALSGNGTSFRYPTKRGSKAAFNRSQAATVRELVRVGSLAFGFDPEEVCGPSRVRAILDVRYILMNFIRTHTGYTLTEIGDVFNRDHTTVLHSLQVYSDQMDVSESFRSKSRLMDQYLNACKIKEVEL